MALLQLAGAFIALGAAFFTIVTHDTTELASGLVRFLGGLAFCLGLVLVVVGGAELFIGNNLIVMAYVDDQVSLTQLLNNWWLVFVGNFIVALSIMLLIYFSGHWKTGNGAVGAHAVIIADAKVNLTWLEAFTRGILCNILVCLAVWLSYAGRSVTEKILAILFPITAFVAFGFEHSVANMFFIPAGLMAQSEAVVTSALTTLVSKQLIITGFFWHNLIPVTLDNIVGGSVFAGLFYWFIYLRKQSQKS